MLRILVISLVVANLFLLGFQRTEPVVEPETPTPKRISGDPRIPTIHLFSEIIEDEDLLSGNRLCFSIGPFYSLEDRDSVRSQLREVATGIDERETQALVEKGYWVFMPPYVSLLEANQELLSLKALGLNDIGIIHDGEWKNAISLGYFLRQENAQRRKKNIESRGYEPLIRVRRQSEPRYWLDYEQSPGSGLLTLDMQGRPNDFMQRSLPCAEERLPSVAADQSVDEFEQPAQEEPVAGNITPQAEAVEDNLLPPQEDLTSDDQGGTATGTLSNNPDTPSENGDIENNPNIEDSDPQIPDDVPSEQGSGGEPEPTDDTETDGS